ncbi:hypothetical protein SEA_SIXAMA_171 [Gordonia phage Sixama]|uniref:Uncharacterized protein n=1 Tax=Gordonia phage Sixama TaxID=2653271 RepID=A0A5Q2F234_9CAUD|nr:hypothetical protein PP302_gp158 [Gordonia phage Sixama]QGF20321.1 hypothetical protein SEA_SIXAMA_171 [Gordonia phage Sixama]
MAEAVDGTYTGAQQVKIKTQAKALFDLVALYEEVGFTRKEAMQLVIATVGRDKR